MNCLSLTTWLSNLTVPFEEDDKDPSIWFLDHNYHESMFSMFKRINGTSRKIFPFLVCLFQLNMPDLIEHFFFGLQQRSMLWGGIALVQSCAKMILTFTAYLMSMFIDPKSSV